MSPRPDTARRAEDPVAAAQARRRLTLRLLVGVQLLAVLLVAAALLAVWLVGRFGDLYGAR